MTKVQTPGGGRGKTGNEGAQTVASLPALPSKLGLAAILHCENGCLWGIADA
jgi:hypothetical protein